MIHWDKAQRSRKSGLSGVDGNIRVLKYDFSNLGLITSKNFNFTLSFSLKHVCEFAGLCLVNKAKFERISAH